MRDFCHHITASTGMRSRRWWTTREEARSRAGGSTVTQQWPKTCFFGLAASLSCPQGAWNWPAGSMGSISCCQSSGFSTLLNIAGSVRSGHVSFGAAPRQARLRFPGIPRQTCRTRAALPGGDPAERRSRRSASQSRRGVSRLPEPSVAFGPRPFRPASVLGEIVAFERSSSGGCCCPVLEL